MFKYLFLFPVDILRNLTPEDSQYEKNYDKEKIGELR